MFLILKGKFGEKMKKMQRRSVDEYSKLLSGEPRISHQILSILLLFVTNYSDMTKPLNNDFYIGPFFFNNFFCKGLHFWG